MDTTTVTFHTGILSETGKVQSVVPCKDGFAVIVDVTPFHPVDHKWPDQPADRGIIRVGERITPLIDCATEASRDSEAEVYFDTNTPVVRSEEVWNHHLAHVVKQDPNIEFDYNTELKLN